MNINYLFNYDALIPATVPLCPNLHELINMVFVFMLCSDRILVVTFYLYDVTEGSTCCIVGEVFHCNID